MTSVMFEQMCSNSCTVFKLNTPEVDFMIAREKQLLMSQFNMMWDPMQGLLG